jgi:hypothetical protein
MFTGFNLWVEKGVTERGGKEVAREVEPPPPSHVRWHLACRR